MWNALRLFQPSCFEGYEMDIEREGTCVYCGTYGVVTADHVVPQCLWSGRVPKDAPVVDACYHCNHVVKSAYDTNLRDLLLIDADSSQSPQAQRQVSPAAK